MEKADKWAGVPGMARCVRGVSHRSSGKAAIQSWQPRSMSAAGVSEKCASEDSLQASPKFFQLPLISIFKCQTWAAAQEDQPESPKFLWAADILSFILSLSYDYFIQQCCVCERRRRGLSLFYFRDFTILCDKMCGENIKFGFGVRAEIMRTASYLKC